MRILQIVFAGLVAAALSGAPAVASASQPANTTLPTQRVSVSGGAHASDAARYAELEAASPDAAQFEGGQRGLRIGLSTGAVVLVALLIVLLLVLL